MLCLKFWKFNFFLKKIKSPNFLRRLSIKNYGINAIKIVPRSSTNAFKNCYQARRGRCLFGNHFVNLKLNLKFWWPGKIQPPRLSHPQLEFFGGLEKFNLHDTKKKWCQKQILSERLGNWGETRRAVEWAATGSGLKCCERAAVVVKELDHGPFRPR